MQNGQIDLSTSIEHRSWIDIRGGGLSALDTFWRGDLRGRRIALVTDDHVDRLLGDSVTRQLVERGAAVVKHVLPAGETTKSADRLHELWEFFLAHRIQRDAVVVALGGGVVGDLAGFAAATFTRGMSLVQIPTTLMAQVDSSIGGKTGINLEAGKNLVGAFWPAKQILIDPAVLSTLPPETFADGLAEVVKYGVIVGADFFSQLERSVAAILERDSKVLEEIIRRCVQCKCDLVRRDPLDRSGERALLNYGHTFGHAIENVFSYTKFSHGQAVAIGMSLAARLALRLNWVDASFVDRQTRLLQSFGLPTQLQSPPVNEIVAAMKFDKKNLTHQTRLILPHGLGQLRLESAIDPQRIRQTLEDANTD